MGRIGQKVARRALGFDMRCSTTTETGFPRGAGAGAQRDLGSAGDELLAGSDILSIHTPYAPETQSPHRRRRVRADEAGRPLSSMRRRGGVVDDAALVAALRSGRLAGRASTFTRASRISTATCSASKNVVLTPHIASSSEATRRSMAMLAARNLVAALAGEAPPNLLNPAVRAYRP